MYFSLGTGLIPKLQVNFDNERLNTMTICPSHRAKLAIVSSRSCSTRGRVPGHGKEKGSGQKVKEDWEKGSLVKVGSGEFYICYWSIRMKPHSFLHPH